MGKLIFTVEEAYRHYMGKYSPNGKPPSYEGREVKIIGRHPVKRGWYLLWYDDSRDARFDHIEVKGTEKVEYLGHKLDSHRR